MHKKIWPILWCCMEIEKDSVEGDLIFKSLYKHLPKLPESKNGAESLSYVTVLML